MSHNQNIIEQISLVKKSQLDPNDLETDCWFPKFAAISDKDLKVYQMEYSFLPDIYLDFLKKFSGARISWLKVLSLNDLERITIADSLSILKESWDHSDGYLPFAEDGGTYVYCFDQNAKVWGFLIGDYSGEPTFLANSFEEFIGDYLLGKKYAEFTDIEDDEFYSFLQKQGWV